ncbi:hypothetical protein TMM008_09040 [Pseudomonas sp. 008]|nr:hypothetical protein TMM008_09040 [Pseudomonas sp. 008]
MLEILIVVHDALRYGDLMSEAIIESGQAASYAALEAVVRCFGVAGSARQIRCKTARRPGPELRV